MAGKLCVFNEVINVDGSELAMLRQPVFNCRNSIINLGISFWNKSRCKLGDVPPNGWPLRFTLAVIVAVSISISIIIGYTTYILHSTKTKKAKLHAKCLLSTDDSTDEPTSFDGDTNSIVVDNSANCIIWKHKSSFIQKSYIKLNAVDLPPISTASGSGLPAGIGDVPIGWYDDEGKYHNFLLKGVYHVPDSPVNILGLSCFSRIVGDYKHKGTRINSSGQDSIFTWDNGKYKRTFVHSDSNMPALPVNNGDSTYHKFCNFIEKLHPMRNQCYHVQSMYNNPNIYNVGEEVLYKNVDHVETGIVEKVQIDKNTNSPVFKIKFRDNRNAVAQADMLQSNDETDLANIPIKPNEFLTHTKCLTQQEILQLQNPTPLSPLEIEWKHIHDMYGHISFATMDKMVLNNMLPLKFKKLKGQAIMCPSCMFGRMRKRAWRSKGLKNLKTIRKENDNYPGATVSTDQLVVAQPGLVPRMSGRHTSERVCGATGFVDHFSNYSYSSLQTSLDGDQTLNAKLAFENHAKTCDVNVKAYRADNGRFAEKSFRDAIQAANQKITFCGVGAHHQNGIIERHFQTLSTRARIILLHAKRHWPEMIATVLWPFAYKYAELLHNHLSIDDKGYSPVQKFCNTTMSLDMHNFHTWGCPCYILDRKLQSQSMLQKWEPRARLGIYLGHSPCHAGSVALVLNPKSLHVSPQYHVAFDDKFETVPYLANSDVPPVWRDLVEKAETSSADEYDLANHWVQAHWENDPDSLGQEGERVAKDTNSTATKVSFADADEEMLNPEGAKNIDMMLQPTLPDINELTRRKSTRKITPTEKVIQSEDKVTKRMFGLAAMQTIIDVAKTTKISAFVTHLENIKTLFDGSVNEAHFYAYNAVASTNDVYTLKQMLKHKDVKEFVSAMLKEIKDHEDRDHWIIYKRSDMPKGSKTILSVWAFKVKRLPDGRIIKYKARLNAHGGMQRWGIDYWETYAPVVNWISVRLMLALSIVHGLKTKSIDFVLAFPQAELERDVFMELPYGFGCENKSKYVLKLKKNLYGLCDASYNWFNKITQGLESEGFVKSEIDQCVFLRKDCIVLLYVDDMIAMSRDDKVLETIVKNLKRKNYILTDEGSLTKYLGVDVKYRKNGEFELTQPFLIQRIIDLLGVEGESVYNTRPTPVTKPLLHKDSMGEVRKHKWNYRKAIGMLTYLQGTTRPDIAMAVHQCARFSIDPRLSHERAVKRIARYLLGNKTRGIKFKPDKSKGIQCYVDADFAGGWNKEDPNNAESVLSRTGYIVFYAGCPMLWASRMQTEIALSTAESEYIACSTALRDVISLMHLLKEIDTIFPVRQKKPEIHCNVYEDNESCIAMAKNRQFKPRTKHIAIKYHHFRKYVGTHLTIKSIDTKQQTADLLTKPLEATAFEYLRNKMNGW